MIRRPVARVPVVADEVRVPGVHGGVVGAHDLATFRVELPRQRITRHVADPLLRARSAVANAIPGVVLRDALGTCRARPPGGGLAQRDQAGQDVADVPLDVGIDEVLGWRAVAVERDLELVEARRDVDLEERLEREVNLCGGRPAQAQDRPVLEPRVDVAQDDAVPGRAHVELDVRATRDLDRLVPDVERDRAALVDVSGWIALVDGLEEEVLGVGPDVRRAPRDPRVVAQHDTRCAGEGDARDIEGASLRHLAAVQPVHDPDRRHREAEMRVVGQDRLAALCFVARDDPVVRPDAIAAHEPCTPIEAGEARDRRAHVRQVGQGRGTRVAQRGDLVPRSGRAAASRGRAGRRAGAPGPDEARRRDHGRRRVVGREQLIRLRPTAEAGVGEESEDLGVDVAAERPRLDLLPGRRVERRPRLERDATDAAGARQQPRDDEWGRQPSVVLVDPGVDAIGVGGDHRDRVGRHRGEVSRRGNSPAERADVPIRVDLARPEQLRESTRADASRDLHLPHALLGMGIALGHEQVVLVVGGDLDDPVAVPADRYRRMQAIDRDPARGLRPAALRGDPAEDDHDDDCERDEHDRELEQSRQDSADQTGGSTHPIPPQRRRVVPLPPAIAARTMTSANTRSARPTPRWVTTTRPGGRGIRARIASPRVLPGSG